MTTTERRIEALELATGRTDTDTEAEALRTMPDDVLEGLVRAIFAKYDDGTGEDPPAEVQRAKRLLGNVERRRAWEKEHWGHLPTVGKVRP